MTDEVKNGSFWRSFWPLFATFLAVDAILLLAFYLTLAPSREKAVQVHVPSGAGVRQIGRILRDQRIINDRFSFSLLVRLRGMGSSLRSGDYEIPPGVKPWGVIDILATGRGELVRITLPEGLTDVQVFARLAAELKSLDSLELRKLARDPAVAAELGLETETLIGYLFPDTYLVPPSISAREMLGLLAGRFHEVWGQVSGGHALSNGLSTRESVILASIVENEAVRDSERPVIASVFLNRLKLGRPLESCATVLYVLGKHKSRLLYSDLSVESPYNTYLHGGLPPGPICNPGRKSLEAVLNPSRTDYLYFVARGDGSHVFSRSLDDHISAKHRIGRAGQGG
jgi:UPF0755 protein